MDEPKPGLSLDGFAGKLYDQMVSEPSEATPAEPSEETENTIEVSEEVEAGEAVASEEEVDEPEETVEPADEDVSQFLSELNDWTRDGEHFDAIKVPTKVNGVEGEATLAELLATHQIGQASEERLNTLKADRAAFEEQKQKSLESFSEQLNQAAGLVQGLEKRFTDQFESINWAELRDTDPAEFAAKQTEKAQVEQQLNSYRTEIQKSYSDQLNKHFQETLERESARILDRIPEWSDNDLALKEKQGIREYLLNQEFSPQEIDGAIENGQIKSMGLVDSRLVKLARKAMLFDIGKNIVDLKTKKVKKLPKVARPGKPEAQLSEDTKKAQAKRSRLKKSGSVDDFAAIIFDGITKEG